MSCLCKGTGRVINKYKTHLAIDPCPDSNCCFDKETATARYEYYANKLLKQFGRDQAYERSL